MLARKATAAAVGPLARPARRRDERGGAVAQRQAAAATLARKASKTAFERAAQDDARAEALLAARLAGDNGGDAAYCLGGSSFEPYPMREEYDAVSDAVDASCASSTAPTARLRAPTRPTASPANWRAPGRPRISLPQTASSSAGRRSSRRASSSTRAW